MLCMWLYRWNALMGRQCDTIVASIHRWRCRCPCLSPQPASLSRMVPEAGQACEETSRQQSRSQMWPASPADRVRQCCGSDWQAVHAPRKGIDTLSIRRSDPHVSACRGECASSCAGEGGHPLLRHLDPLRPPQGHRCFQRPAAPGGPAALRHAEGQGSSYVSASAIWESLPLSECLEQTAGAKLQEDWGQGSDETKVSPTGLCNKDVPWTHPAAG